LKDKKLNILFLASWYPNDESTQAGNFIQQHAKAVSLYCNVSVVHTVPVKNQKEDRISKAWNNGVYEVIVYYQKTDTSLPFISNYQKANRKQAAYKKGYSLALNEIGSFDLTHLNVVYPAGIFALYLNNKYKTPFVLSEHWTAFQAASRQSFNTWQKFLIKKIASKASFICPVSEDLKKAMISFGINHSYKVIPNVINTNVFKLNSSKIKTQSTKILHLSNLKDEQKNISGILNVIKRLSEKRTDFVLTIAGNGPIEKYQKLAKELNISKELLTFMGERNNHEVFELMHSHHFFLLFSNYETFSIVIAEAWACGLPVIATRCGGLTEAITEENGIQVPVKNEAALTTAIHEMLDNIHHYDGEKISRSIDDQYSYGSIGKQLNEIYKSILS